MSQSTHRLQPSAGHRPRSGRHLLHWRNRRVRGWAYQLLAAAAILGLLVYFGNNAVRSLAARGMQPGLSFLLGESGISMAETILPFHSTDSFIHAMAAGLGNTLWVWFISTIFATVLGILLGVTRLSPNWLAARAATVYVEVFRNTPQLIQIVFWYTLFTLLPAARQAFHGGSYWYLSKRGLFLAWPENRSALVILVVVAVLGVLLALRLLRWHERRAIRTGKALPAPAAIGAAVPIVMVAAAWLALGRPTTISHPELVGFNFRGGMEFSPEFLALWMGLTLYFAAYISEIVRSGIQSVSKGQIEAARALNLRGARLYRKIILPQAMRVMIPPLSAQYISIIKTSALGVAIGYPELFNVSNSVMTITGHVLECLFIMGLIYLLMAILISALMNAFNRSIALRGLIR